MSAVTLFLLCGLGATVLAVVAGALITLCAGFLPYRVRDDAVAGITGRCPADARAVRRHCLLPLAFSGVGALCIRSQVWTRQHRVFVEGGRRHTRYDYWTGLHRVLVVHGGRLWPWRGLLLDIAAASAVMGVSSIIDWCVTVPRMSANGDPGKLPCRTSASGSWGGLTQLWVAHRVTAYVIVRLAALGLLALTIAGIDPHISQVTGTVIGATSAALLVFFANRLLPAMKLVSNPPMHVGDKVTLAEQYATGLAEQPTYYVVDVGFEGVKLRELIPDGQTRRPSANGEARGTLARWRTGRNASPPRLDAPVQASDGHTYDRSVDLDDIARLLRRRGAFTGCQVLCSGINNYCPLRRRAPIPKGSFKDGGAAAHRNPDRYANEPPQSSLDR